MLDNAEAKEEADAGAPLKEELEKKMESMPDDEDELLKRLNFGKKKAAVVCTIQPPCSNIRNTKPKRKT